MEKQVSVKLTVKNLNALKKIKAPGQSYNGIIQELLLWEKKAGRYEVRE